MDHFFSLLSLALISLLAAISPGPDFFIVFKNSLSSRKAGLITALGVSLALVIHLTYTMLGLAVLIQESAWIYQGIKYTGALYLLYLGYSGIKSSFRKKAFAELESQQQIIPVSNFEALKQGFLTNLLNPKAAVFFMSLFSQYIDKNTAALMKIEYAFVNWVMTLGWFITLTYIVSSEYLLQKINRFRATIDRTMGSVLVLIGLKILLA
jgi:RhtB (resistance to homoserine/threonine) family protein